MVDRRIEAARFPATKSLDTFDFLAMPSVNKHLVMQLARCEYVDRRENVIATGNSGTGKTHGALGLGLAACQRGLSVGFTTAHLAGSRADRGQGRAAAAQPPEEAGTAQAADHRRAWLRPALQDRRRAPLRGLQPEIREGGRSWSPPSEPFDEWTEVFGSERLTGALLDRLTHRVHILEMNGESYRLKQSRLAAITRSAGDSPDT